MSEGISVLFGPRWHGGGGLCSAWGLVASSRRVSADGAHPTGGQAAKHAKHTARVWVGVQAAGDSPVGQGDQVSTACGSQRGGLMWW